MTVSIKFPAFAKAREFGATLVPANARRMRPFTQAMTARAIVQIAPRVICPAQQNRFWEVNLIRRVVPYRCERLGFAEAAFVCLLRGVVVRVHHYGFGNVNDLIALRTTPARVLIILGILHFFQEPAPAPDVFSQA